MPSLIHNSKSNSRPDLPVDTQNDIEGGVFMGRDECCHAICSFFLQNFQKVLAQRESRGHVERRHMANPLCYTSGMDLHLLEEGGVSYTKVPLAFT